MNYIHVIIDLKFIPKTNTAPGAILLKVIYLNPFFLFSFVLHCKNEEIKVFITIRAITHLQDSLLIL